MLIFLTKIEKEGEIMMNKSKEISYDELDEIDEMIESATDGPWEIDAPEGEEWRQQAKDFAFIAMARTQMPILVKQLRLYMQNNEQMQSLDGMQQSMIERLNHEVARLRESIKVLEDQHRLMLVEKSVP